VILVARKDAKTPRFSSESSWTTRSMLSMHLNGGIHHYVIYLILRHLGVFASSHETKIPDIDGQLLGESISRHHEQGRFGPGSFA
jgi:hypothetical protein